MCHAQIITFMYDFAQVFILLQIYICPMFYVHCVLYYKSTEVPPIEPPIVGFQSSESTEDSAILLSITVRTADTNPDSETTIVVRNVPQGATLNYGTQVGNEWIVPLESLPDLAMIPPSNFNGNVTLLFIATTMTPSGDVKREIYLPLTLRAVADPVILDVEHTCFSPGQTMIPLTIGIQASDRSERIAVMISGVPHNVSLSPAVNVLGRQYLVQSEDLEVLQLVFSTDLVPPTFALNVTVRSTETSNGDSWEDSASLQITQCPHPKGRAIIVVPRARMFNLYDHCVLWF